MNQPSEPTHERDARPREVATAGRLIDARHGALKAIQLLTGYLPNKALWGEIVEVLGDVPDYPRLQAVYQAWIKRGFKPVNYAWVFDWYVNGIPEENRPRAHSPPGGAVSSPQSQANFSAVQRWLDKKGHNDGTG